MSTFAQTRPTKNRAHICHEYHEFYPWRKNCHVEKFQLSIQNLNNLWSFYRSLCRFCSKSVRRKNDKYEVCRQLDDNLVGQLTTQPLDIHVLIFFIRLIFQTSIISDKWSSVPIRLNWDWKLKLWEGVSDANMALLHIWHLDDVDIDTGCDPDTGCPTLT